MFNQIKFSFFTYQKKFKKPLVTNHGVWKVREGIIIELEKEGKKTVSEIAPLPWFGTETLLEAKQFCKLLGSQISVETVNSISDNLPCCQFAFQSALNNLFLCLNNQKLTQESDLGQRFDYSYLLITGKKVLEQAMNFDRQYLECKKCTFKWKIGVDSYQEEKNTFQELINLLPSGSNLRLDANGGLNFDEARKWLEITDQLEIVEFIEQPLPIKEFDLMVKLGKDYKTLLALDESVASFQQLKFCYEKGWQGVFVIKPLIAGYPNRLEAFCLKNQLDVVVSSVLETTIGRKIALQLAKKIQNPHRAIGFGINHWFEDNDN